MMSFLALIMALASPVACLKLAAPPAARAEAHAAGLSVHGEDSTALKAQVRALLNGVVKLGSDVAQKCEGDAAGKKPVPKPETAPYSPRTCRNLFPFQDDRELCMKLQKAICTKGCGCLFSGNETVTTQCEDLKKTLCDVPVLAPASNATVVENGSNATMTFCNAYLSNQPISIQHDKHYALPDPPPFVSKLGYLDCAQAKIPAGEKVNVYLGSMPMTKHVVGSEGALVVLGQYNVGELEMAISIKTFEDEGYKRPIICSAYPTSQMHVGVVGRKWHPFSDAGHPTSLAYMECQKLALDHADSVFQPETLEFFDGETHKGDVEIDPVKTLYLIGAPENADKDLLFKAYNYDHLMMPKAKVKAKAKARAKK